MNPAVMNYLQSQQSNQMEQNPQENAPFNPFDAGINRAISSAQQSLGMTEKQQDKALRRSLLTFANNMAAQPKQRGFFNNFGSAARALSPAIMEHDQYEDYASQQNQNMANQILGYKAAEEAKQNAMEQQDWARGHAENQLAEQRRYHDMMSDYQRQKLQSQPQSKSDEHGRSDSSSDLMNILDDAEAILTEDLEKKETYRGRTSNLLSKFIPGGYIPTEQQAQINALGDVLRGKLFNLWKYRNQTEFEHVPSISADNPPEVNLEIIKTLKNQFNSNRSEKNSIPLEKKQSENGKMPPETEQSEDVLSNRWQRIK